MLLVNTGVLVAADNTDETHHQPETILLEGNLVTTDIVSAETACFSIVNWGHAPRLS